MHPTRFWRLRPKVAFQLFGLWLWLVVASTWLRLRYAVEATVLPNAPAALPPSRRADRHALRARTSADPDGTRSLKAIAKYGGQCRSDARGRTPSKWRASLARATSAHGRGRRLPPTRTRSRWSFPPASPIPARVTQRLSFLSPLTVPASSTLAAVLGEEDRGPEQRAEAHDGQHGAGAEHPEAQAAQPDGGVGVVEARDDDESLGLSKSSLFSTEPYSITVHPQEAWSRKSECGVGRANVRSVCGMLVEVRRAAIECGELCD